MQKKKFKVWCVIISGICTFLIACVLLECFLPSFFGEEYRGANHYSEGDYKTFGHGFNRYGKIASEYLPEYDEAAEDATYVYVRGSSCVFYGKHGAERYYRGNRIKNYY